MQAICWIIQTRLIFFPDMCTAFGTTMISVGMVASRESQAGTFPAILYCNDVLQSLCTPLQSFMIGGRSCGGTSVRVVVFGVVL